MKTKKRDDFIYNQLGFMTERSIMKMTYLDICWRNILLVIEKYQQTRSPRKHLLWKDASKWMNHGFKN